MITTAMTAWALVHFVWQGAIVALALAGVLTATRSWSANIRYTFGVVALVIMAALPVWTALRLRSGSFDLMDRSVVSGAVAMSDATRNTAKPIDGAERVAPLARSATADMPRAVRMDSRPMSPAFTTAMLAQIAEWTNAAAPIVVAIWLAGVLLLSVRLAGGWLRVRRLTTQGIAAASQATSTSLKSIAKRMGVTRSVTLFESAMVDVPTVVGWLRPVLLLPLSLESGLSVRDVELLLAHELAHIRRHDYFVNLLQTMVETILFYHPGVWWVSARVREEREHCCDDAAAALCDDLGSYASALLRMEQQRQRGPQLAMAANGGSLLRRVRRLLRSTDAAHDTRGRWAAMPLGIAALVGLASWVTTGNALVPASSPVGDPSAMVAAAETTRASMTRNARPDTVIVFRGAATALDARWSWAEGVARRASAPAVWIGYRIAGDASRGFAYLDHRVPVYTGTGTMMGSMRFKGTTSGMTFVGVRMDSLVGPAPHEDQVVLFGFVQRNGRLELDRVHASTFALPVHFAGRPLYWLGEAEDEQSVELVRRMYGASAGKDLRSELIDVVGLHVSERPVLRAIEAWLGDGQEFETRRNAAGQLGNLESANALALATRVARQDGARDVRREAAEAIGEMRVAGALDTLGALTRSLDDREVRKEAVESLGERPEPEAAEMLVRLAWNDTDEEVQKEAVETLGETHSPKAANELARIAREHPRTEVRREAVETLGELEEPATVLPILSDIVEHNSSTEVRKEAIETLGELKTDAALRAVRGYARSSADGEVRRAAIEVLAEDGNTREAHDILTSIVKEGTESDQKAAVERLAEIEDPRVVSSLREIAVTHANESVRLQAIESLSEAKAKGEALDAISELIWKGKDPATEKRAVETLAEMEGADVVDRLVKVVDEHPEREVRREAVERLGNVEHNARAQAQLARLARSSSDESIAKAALEAYANSARPADVIALAKSVLNSSKSEEMLKAGLDALENIDSNAGIPAMIEIAQTHPNRELRRRAIGQLGDSDDPRAHAAMAKLLEEKR